MSALIMHLKNIYVIIKVELANNLIFWRSFFKNDCSFKNNFYKIL